MKTKLLLVMAGLVAWAGSVSAQKDHAAIQAVIEKETQAFLTVDRDAWKATWLQAPYAYWSYSDSTGTSYKEGWDQIEASFREYFTSQKHHRPIDVAYRSTGLKVERTWQDFRIYKNGAYVRFTQRVTEESISRDETSQVRVLEKKDGQWKIVCVSVIARYPQD